MKRPGPSGGESGVALLSALLAVALLTIVVVEFADSTLIHAHLSRNAGNALAAQLLARSAVVGAEGLLMQDDRDNDVTYDGELPWSLPWDIPTANGNVFFQIRDEDGKLDLNQVGDKDQRRALEKLFGDLGFDPKLLNAVQAWISPNPESVEGRAASEYCALSMPCEPLKRPLQSLDELRLIRGFDQRMIAALRPLVTAYGTTRGKPGVNVNTANPRVLSAIGCKVGADFEVPPGGFQNADAVEQCRDVKRMIRTESSIFWIQAFGTVGDVTQSIDAIVQRTPNKATRLVWRERPRPGPPRRDPDGTVHDDSDLLPEDAS